MVDRLANLDAIKREAYDRGYRDGQAMADGTAIS
jgi:hypothetical protein